MHCHLTRLAALMLCVHGFSTACHAQLVQVGPGFVKAPFVRVYWCPDGTTRVRAPFVDIVTPGRRSIAWAHPGPAYDQGPYNQAANPENFSEMDWRSLRASIRHLAASLDSQLERFRTGDLWKVELKTAEIRALVQAEDGPPSPEQATALGEILLKFEATRAKSEDHMISDLSSFQSLDAAIREFLAPPADRTRRQLVAAADELDRALRPMRTGEGWRKYLALPDALAQAPANEPPPLSAAQVAELETLLGRFESVSQNDEYRATNRLTAFRAARDRLSAYLTELRGEKPQAKPAPAEELPLPAPAK